MLLVTIVHGAMADMWMWGKDVRPIVVLLTLKNFSMSMEKENGFPNATQSFV